MGIDWNKPLKTRDGFDVSVIDKNARNPGSGWREVVCQINTHPYTYTRHRPDTGEYLFSKPKYDLFNPPEEKEVTLYFHESGIGNASGLVVWVDEPAFVTSRKVYAKKTIKVTKGEGL